MQEHAVLEGRSRVLEGRSRALEGRSLEFSNMDNEQGTILVPESEKRHRVVMCNVLFHN